jgi:hypothetical protein
LALDFAEPTYLLKSRHFVVESQHGVLGRTIRSYIRSIRHSLPPTPPASQADKKKLRRHRRHYSKESVLHFGQQASLALAWTFCAIGAVQNLIITPTDVWVWGHNKMQTYIPYESKETENKITSNTT